MNKAAVTKLVGKKVYAIHKNGGTLSGKLVKISGNTLYVQPDRANGKKVHTKAIAPLVLFDLLAIGTAPYGYGYGYGNPYYGNFGYPGFFW